MTQWLQFRVVLSCCLDAFEGFPVRTEFHMHASVSRAEVYNIQQQQQQRKFNINITDRIPKHFCLFDSSCPKTIWKNFSPFFRQFRLFDYSISPYSEFHRFSMIFCQDNPRSCRPLGQAFAGASRTTRTASCAKDS